MPSALAPTAPYWEEAVAEARAAAVARTLEKAGHLPHVPGERAGYRLWTNGVAHVFLEYRDREGHYGILTNDTAYRWGARECPDCAPGQYEQARTVRAWDVALDRAGWRARLWTPERRHHSVGGTVHTSLRCGVTARIPLEPRRATAGEYLVRTHEALGGYFESRYTQDQAQSTLNAAHRRGFLVTLSSDGMFTVPRHGGTRIELRPVTAAMRGHAALKPSVEAVCAVLRDEEWGDYYGAPLVYREGDEVIVAAQWEDADGGEKGERAMQRHHDTMERYAGALEKRWQVQRVRRGSVLIPGARFVGALRIS
ncbi:hypothetical protein ABZ619_39005 [Streptomyces sp. NPDC007851]|uniref:hypothetical protein n=1 Tax=Streptomyces sp. NPDC007851 TaxID=3155008 RepID=UPI0033E44450